MKKFVYFLLNLDMSVPEFAELLGITKHCVYRWLRGNNYPSARHAVKIVTAFKNKITLEDMGYEEKNGYIRKKKK